VSSRARVLAAAAVLAACGASAPPPLDRVPTGTWGGEDAGLIVGADGAHAHVGCTRGDVAGAIPVDADGRFDVAGTYSVDAFPVSRDTPHPARFTGQTDGHALSFTVAVTDTGQTFSSGELVLGREPRMVNCPICRRPPLRTSSPSPAP
jgi:hypothetical protein